MFKRRSKFNKYNAKRIDGFPSMLERSVFMILLARERDGELTNIKRQQRVVLQDGDKDVLIAWKVDFSAEVVATKETIYIESKGIETNDYVLKLKLWRKNPPATLEIWKGSHAKPYLHERIEKK